VTKREVAFTFAWTRRVVEARGWQYVVWSEPPPAELENVRFLAGYRRDWLFEGERHPEREREELRSAALHLLWAGEVVTDLSTPISSRHVLKVPQ
jgi:hypothetical protein